MPKPRTCRECRRDRPLGRNGRCSECGMERMVLGFRWSGVFSHMTNAQVEKKLLTLEKRYGSGGEPRRDQFAAFQRARQALRAR